MKYVPEVVDSRHHAIVDPRLNDMFPRSTQKLSVEYLLQNWRSQFHCCVQCATICGIVQHASVRESLGVIRLMQGERRSQVPAAILQRQGNLRAEVEPSQQVVGLEARLAAGKSGKGCIERPKQRPVAYLMVHTRCVNAGGVQYADRVKCRRVR